LNIIKEESLDQFEDFISILKKVAEENQYIKFENNASAKQIAAIKSLNPSQILSD